MSTEAQREGIALPRETLGLIGHADAEQALLDAYRSGRMPHAWMLGGPRGIGKATLAYRMARFILAHPDPHAQEVAAATSLAVAEDHPVVRRVAAQAHGDLFVLERTENDKGVMRQAIAVEDVRRAVNFFGTTAGEGGWRIAIVDAVDELNSSSANALLKVLEEPPERSLLLLVSHAAGRALPTLRSRCRRLTLRGLEADDLAAAVATVTARMADEPDILEAAQGAEGSVARALALLEGRALALRQRVQDHLARLPAVDQADLHGLGDALAGSDAAPLGIFVDTVNDWLSAELGRRADIASRMRLATAWERMNAAARDVEAYNLERKPFVFSVFGLLAEAARG